MRIVANALILTACVSLGQVAHSEVVSVAVASNFSETANQLARDFNRSTGHVVRVSSGSSGKLYAQILNGAPFDVFLSADAERPRLLEERGRAVPGSRFSYAQGALVLWSRRPQYAGKDCLRALKNLDVDHLAIANPATAPYGAAAKQWLQGLGLWDRLSEKLVTGENIGQTFHFVATQNAGLGLIAAAQLASHDLAGGTCSYTVPLSAHDPILQQAVLLKRGAGKAAAREFLDSLRSAAALELIRQSGYHLPR